MQDRERIWAYFESKGEIEIRKEIGSGMMGEANVKLAREWFAHKASERSSAENAASLAEARSANDLARAANSVALAAAASAAASARAAQTNNIIATLALIAAITAIAISIVGIFVKA